MHIDTDASTHPTKEDHFKTHLVEQILALAMLEDLGPEPLDVTSAATVSPTAKCSARLVLKESAVICGLNILETVAKCLASPDSQLEVIELFNEGTYITVHAGPVTVATIATDARCLLAAERLSLNLIQRMCGVATLAQAYTKKAQPHGIQILDTRKTMPGLRVFDRRAVLAGGGTNHRFGLFDAILIKDNHVLAAGGVASAVNRAREYLQNHQGPNLQNKQIEVEVTTLAELGEALATRADRVLLDNMPPELVRQAVAMVGDSGHECFIEVSGGVNEKNLESYLIAGVNAISIGAITHSAKNIDLSLEFD
jgi:nicotinate-nucleotide pyrophosphorylase (carboxylating)